MNARAPVGWMAVGRGGVDFGPGLSKGSGCARVVGVAVANGLGVVGTVGVANGLDGAKGFGFVGVGANGFVEGDDEEPKGFAVVGVVVVVVVGIVVVGGNGGVVVGSVGIVCDETNGFDWGAKGFTSGVVVVVGGGVVVVAVVVGGACGEPNGFVCCVVGGVEANGLLAVVKGIVGVGGGGPCDGGGDLVVAKRFLTCFCGVHEGVGPGTGGTKGCWSGAALELPSFAIVCGVDVGAPDGIGFARKG